MQCVLACIDANGADGYSACRPGHCSCSSCPSKPHPTLRAVEGVSTAGPSHSRNERRPYAQYSTLRQVIYFPEREDVRHREGKPMRRRCLIAIAASMSAMALGAPAVLLGQPNQLPLIAMLIGSNPKISSSRFFLDELSKLGYVQSKDYRLEARYAEQHPERLRPLAEEL